MRNIDELKQKRHWEVTQARKIKDRVDAEEREFTAEEQTHFEAHMAEFDGLSGKVKAEERMISAEAAVASRVDTEDSSGGQVEDERGRLVEGFRSYLSGEPISIYNTLSEYRALQADSDTTGGYLVPSAFSNDLIKELDNLVFIRGLSTSVSIPKAESLGVPTLSNRIADATWTKELAIGTEDSTLDFGTRELFPRPLAKYIKVSNTLLRKSPTPIEGIVREELAYNFSIVEEQAFMTGSGANQPLGVFTASADGISTSRDVSTGNTNTTITADGLKEAKYSLTASHRRNCTWIFHRDAIKLMAKLKDGNGRYLWQDSLVGSEPDKLLGFPAYESEYAPSTFTTGLYVGILGNFKYFKIADSLAMTLQRLDELGAATDQTYFIGRKETDAMPILQTAFARVTLT